jgi:methylglutamate dehydrogenase subunit D
MAVNTGCGLSIHVFSTLPGSVTVSEASTESLAALAEHRSPFEGHVEGAQASFSGQIGVRLHAHTLPGVVQIATWPAAIAALEQSLTQVLALAGPLPARTGQVAELAQARLMRTGPQEFLLVTATGDPMVGALRVHIPSDVGSVTDLGHARCRIRISGDACVATLGKLFALDFREAVFPIGELRLTGHHHVPCALHRRAPDRFEIYVFTTYAHDQLATLLDAAREHGVALALGADPTP